MELVQDKNFKITGEGRYLEYQSPFDLYEAFQKSEAHDNFDQVPDFEVMARLLGGNNKNNVLSYPNTFEDNIKALLEPHGMYTEEVKVKVEKLRYELQEFVNGPLQDIKKLEETREAIGTHKGRAGNLASNENPIVEIWNIVKKSVAGMTADRFFGFDLIEKHGYEVWPMYFGIIGCHAVLNFIGFRPEGELSKAENMAGILSDGSHIGYAAYCQGLLSRDRKLIAKANAIYCYKNIGTQLVTVEYKKGKKKD